MESHNRRLPGQNNPTWELPMAGRSILKLSDSGRIPYQMPVHSRKLTMPMATCEMFYLLWDWNDNQQRKAWLLLYIVTRHI